MLKKLNWGAVWENIPINKKNISPKIMVPLRFFFKIPFSLFGEKGIKSWHNFETVFLKYWMDPINYYCSNSYLDVIKEYRNKPKNSISFITKNFVKSKNI